MWIAQLKDSCLFLHLRYHAASWVPGMLKPSFMGLDQPQQSDSDVLSRQGSRASLLSREDSTASQMQGRAAPSREGSGKAPKRSKRPTPGFRRQFAWCLSRVALQRTREPLIVVTDYAIFALTGTAACTLPLYTGIAQDIRPSNGMTLAKNCNAKGKALTSISCNRQAKAEAKMRPLLQTPNSIPYINQWQSDVLTCTITSVALLSSGSFLTLPHDLVQGWRWAASQREAEATSCALMWTRCTTMWLWVC